MAPGATSLTASTNAVTTTSSPIDRSDAATSAVNVASPHARGGNVPTRPIRSGTAHGEDRDAPGAVGDTSLAISTLTQAEVYFVLESKGSKRLWLQFESLLKDRLRVIPFDEQCAGTFGNLKALAKRKGVHPSDFDLAIAATALSESLARHAQHKRFFFHH